MYKNKYNEKVTHRYTAGVSAKYSMRSADLGMGLGWLVELREPRLLKRHTKCLSSPEEGPILGLGVGGGRMAEAEKWAKRNLKSTKNSKFLGWGWEVDCEGLGGRGGHLARSLE